MPRTLFNLLKYPIGQQLEKQIDLEPLVKALPTRAVMLEEPNLLFVVFRHKKAKSIDADQPTM